MTVTDTTRVALERLVRELRSRIDGLPDHPWVPGAKFHDGALLAALEDAETTLTLSAPRPRASYGAQVGDHNTQVNHF